MDLLYIAILMVARQKKGPFSWFQCQSSLVIVLCLYMAI